MKKWERRYWVGMTIACILVCIMFFFIIINKNKLSIHIIQIGRIITVGMCILIVVAILGYFLINSFMVMKNGMHNIKKCDDDFFDGIDKYKRCWTEGKQYYIQQIQILNLYYKKNGKVDELVKNNEIGRLFAREDYLKVQNSVYDNMTTYCYSLVISVIASLIYQILGYENVVFIFVCIIVILLVFFCLVLSEYAERGKVGSYRYLINEYERELLSKKIKILERNLTFTEDDEKILETKQIVIDELINIRQRCKGKKQKEQVTNDIICIEQLNLCLENYGGCYKKKIYVNQKKCYLLYDHKKGKDNNYIGEHNLKTQEYCVLYQILKKYELMDA